MLNAIAKACGICKKMCEIADMHYLGSWPVHCWPCWEATATAKRFNQTAPPGWWQICERCGDRNWVMVDRPLCPQCVRVPKRWRGTWRRCRCCGLAFRPARKERFCCTPYVVRSARMDRARALGTHTATEWELCMFEHGFACAYCGRTGIPLTKDHVIPVSRGGSDSITNIAPACHPCNSAKGPKTLAEWARFPNVENLTRPKRALRTTAPLVSAVTSMAYKQGVAGSSPAVPTPSQRHIP